MNIQEILQVTASVFITLGGASVIIFALAKWLADLWQARIIEDRKSGLLREHELLIRRRNVYAKLVVAMRIFLNSTPPATNDQKNTFLNAYDEAALWASESVVLHLSKLIKLAHIKPTADRGENSHVEMRSAFIDCIKEMRRDCGFPSSNYEHQIIRF